MILKKWMRISSFALLIAFLAPLLVGCAPPSTGTPTLEPTRLPVETQPAASEFAVSNLERNLSPDVSAQELAELVAGNNAFALDFYQAVRAQQGNLFFSPYSLSLALAMTYAGARGETETQMADTLRFDLPQERLHAAFNALDLQLAVQPDPDPDVEEGRRFQLNVANSIWAQQGYPFLSEFLDLLALNYGSGMNLVDFINAAEAARLQINQWVSDQTEGKIEDLIPQGAVDDLTRMVLVNTIYFTAAWTHQFDKNLTQDGAFNLLDGSQVQATMMAYSQPKRLNYLHGEGYQAVELPYEGSPTAMLLILPDPEKFADIETALDADGLAAILSALESKTVDLKMPKFEFASRFGLAEVLEQMGMPNAFDPDLADLSGIDGTRDLYVKDVIHEAYVAVDEEGTEAAAATAIIIGVESMPMTEIELTIDRPFIFVIRHLPTDTILFAGRVLNPLE
jgi:serpin B